MMTCYQRYSVASDAVNDGELEDEHIATTVWVRAVCVIDSDRITLDTKMAVFIVKGINESRSSRVVRLFPKPSCSCPAQMRCSKFHVF